VRVRKQQKQVPKRAEQGGQIHFSLKTCDFLRLTSHSFCALCLSYEGEFFGEVMTAQPRVRSIGLGK